MMDTKRKIIEKYKENTEVAPSGRKMVDIFRIIKLYDLLFPNS